MAVVRSVLGLLASYILMASLIHTVYPNDLDGCPPIHVYKNRILRTKESLNNGAKYIHKEEVQSARECFKLCCERENCNMAMLSYKNSSNVFGGLDRTCYLFNCGSPSKCTFSPYDHYAVIEFEDGSKVRSNKKDQTKKIKQLEYCPPEVPVAMCTSNPCVDAKCPSNPLAFCKPSTCGFCHAIFYDDNGNKVNCYAQNQNRQPVETNFPNNYKWYEDKKLLAEIENVHPNNHRKPTYKPSHNLENRLHNMAKNHQQLHQRSKVSSASKSSIGKEKTNLHEFEQPAHRFSGSSSLHKTKPPVTDPPFHHWREFIDNNPKFGKAKLATEKPTTKPITHKKSTEVYWREFIDNNPKFTHKPVATMKHPTNPKLTSKVKPIHKDKKTRPPTNSPPRVDNDRSSKRNITDVQVVIETSHLRIVENKAVVPLAIFLVIAIVMLLVVGLRLRMMKRRIRRKAFATDDADYLINGMYL